MISMKKQQGRSRKKHYPKLMISEEDDVIALFRSRVEAMIVWTASNHPMYRVGDLIYIKRGETSDAMEFYDFCGEIHLTNSDK